MNGALRVGIDVGGTFTDVVAVDATSGEVVARIKVPTTHDAPEGVAAGIVAGIRRALETPGVSAGRIAFIAHSTTQATNALLEGDVAKVGTLALVGRFDLIARRQMRLPPLTLGPGAVMESPIAYARAGNVAEIGRALDELAAHGVAAIAASGAFGVDRPAGETQAVEAAHARGLLATSGHEVSSMYGLRARTRTAVLNAAILPRMLHTSRMTAQAVRKAGIGVPLMIMRSDGGVMDVREVGLRPILTMLSGPASRERCCMKTSATESLSKSAERARTVRSSGAANRRCGRHASAAIGRCCARSTYARWRLRAAACCASIHAVAASRRFVTSDPAPRTSPACATPAS